MVIFNRPLAILALVLATIVLAATGLASPSYAQSAGHHISAARAAAIHECSVRADQYPENDWGNTEIYVYRACMADHGQQE
jgi:hypothetical protein